MCTRLSHPRSFTLEHAGPVVVLLSRDQRLNDNWAVVYAQNVARSLAVPLVVTFASDPVEPETTLRAWSFALGGMAEVQRACADASFAFVLLHGSPGATAGRFAIEEGASLFVTDFSPLRADRAWRSSVGAELESASPPIPACEVDAHNAVPVWIASPKLEYAARTLRPRVMGQLGRFLVEYPKLERSTVAWRSRGPVAAAPEAASSSSAASVSALRWTEGAGIDWSAALAAAPLDRSVTPVTWAEPGPTAGSKALADFLSARLADYDGARNDPTRNATSGLSPWLHFGQLSPARAVLEAYRIRSARAGTAPSAKVVASIDAFVEELIVRRELSENYCHYNPRCEAWGGAWADPPLAVALNDTNNALAQVRRPRGPVSAVWKRQLGPENPPRSRWRRARAHLQRRRA